MTVWHLDDTHFSSSLASVVVTQMTQLYSGSGYMQLAVQLGQNPCMTVANTPRLFGEDISTVAVGQPGLIPQHLTGLRALCICLTGAC